jgi:hypothetical protein
MIVAMGDDIGRVAGGEGSGVWFHVDLTDGSVQPWCGVCDAYVDRASNGGRVCGHQPPDPSREAALAAAVRRLTLSTNEDDPELQAE